MGFTLAVTSAEIPDESFVCVGFDSGSLRPVRVASESLLRLRMAMSETSLTGSMRMRLAEHSPECDAVLGKEASFGTFTVTMMWQAAMPGLTDLMGGCVVVVTIARKGDTHGGA